MEHRTAAHAHDWWRGAVIYQIYPRSFYDTNHDGIGDLPGITEQLDYVSTLGVDALWISPFMKSPMKDFGYDVSDYRDVDPMFGTLSDFDRLLAEAHLRGLKVIIDLVPAHTSDQHPWFLESRRGRNGRRADFYVWHDPKPDGAPPNNWLAVFGGVAWHWEPRRAQYYLHHFLPSQPALNLHNPEAAGAMLSEARFWLDRGVDGFRLDAVNYCMHDRQFRDNPPRSPEEWTTDAIVRSNPYRMQRHLYDKSQPENLQFLERIRALLDRYPGTTTLGEVGDDNAIPLSVQYTQGTGRLHQAYNFSLLRSHRGARFVHDTVAFAEQCLGNGNSGGWLCWALSNHDVPRVVTRWGEECRAAGLPEEALAKVLLALLFCLRGSVCLYQGEELGLPEVELPYEQIQDPYGLAFWPEFSGRDGCRIPLPWSATAEHGGFSQVRPWLPVPESVSYRGRAVDTQERDADSVLHACRRLLTFRRHHPALRRGSIQLLPVEGPVLTFERRGEGEHLLLAFNLGPVEASLPIGEYAGLQQLFVHGFTAALYEREVRLPPYQAFFAVLPVAE